MALRLHRAPPLAAKLTPDNEAEEAVLVAMLRELAGGYDDQEHRRAARRIIAGSAGGADRRTGERAQKECVRGL